MTCTTDSQASISRCISPTGTGCVTPYTRSTGHMLCHTSTPNQRHHYAHTRQMDTRISLQLRADSSCQTSMMCSAMCKAKYCCAAVKCLCTAPCWFMAFKLQTFGGRRCSLAWSGMYLRRLSSQPTTCRKPAAHALVTSDTILRTGLQDEIALPMQHPKVCTTHWSTT
jgi:hypothetical protein